MRAGSGSSAPTPARRQASSCRSSPRRRARRSPPLLPVEASTANPVDMLGSATADSYRAVLPAVLADPGIDAVIVLFVPPVAVATVDVGAAISERRRGNPARPSPCWQRFLPPKARPRRCGVPPRSRLRLSGGCGQGTRTRRRSEPTGCAGRQGRSRLADVDHATRPRSSPGGHSRMRRSLARAGKRRAAAARGVRHSAWSPSARRDARRGRRGRRRARLPRRRQDGRRRSAQDRNGRRRARPDRRGRRSVRRQSASGGP